MNEPPKASRELVWATRWVSWLDDALRIPGTSIRFGLDPIVGALLPGAGDALSAIGSLALLVLAVKQRVPTQTLLRMLLNILLDVALGALPVVGDFFDFQWKANRRNLELIEHHRHQSPTPARARDYLIVIAAVVGVGALLALSSLIAILLLRALWPSAALR